MDIRITEADPQLLVGVPQTTLLTSLLATEALPQVIEHALAEADYYLVQFSVVLKVPKGHRRERLRRLNLAVSLTSTDNGQPVIWDAIPKETGGPGTDVIFALTSNLRFAPDLASSDSSPLVLEYDSLPGRVVAAGIGTDRVEWRIVAKPGSDLGESPQVMHALVRAPQGSRPGRARIDVAVELSRYPLRLPIMVKTRYFSKTTNATLWNGMGSRQAAKSPVTKT